MISKRAQELPPFIVMEILEKAQKLEAEGHDVIHMEIGEPDFKTPDIIVEAARKALDEGKTQYTHSLGLPRLRDTIASYYLRKYGVEVDPARVIVTKGTSPAMLLLFAAILDPGDEVILSNPCYSCYPNFVRFVGGRPVFVYVEEADGFEYRPKAIEDKIGPSTKAVMINSPSNPTGTLLSPAVVKSIAAFGGDNLLVVSDEIYHGMVYEGKEHTILEFTDDAVVINGFSKLFAMTGWRLGYMIVPELLVRPIQKLQQNLFISANSFVQWAGVAALEKAGPDVDRMVATYNERRLYLVPRLRELGFGIAMEPTGAFYVLANAKTFSRDSYSFALELLEKTKVAVTPGVDFGDGAEGYIRFTYANSLEKIKVGCDRLGAFLEG